MPTPWSVEHQKMEGEQSVLLLFLSFLFLLFLFSLFLFLIVLFPSSTELIFFSSFLSFPFLSFLSFPFLFLSFSFHQIDSPLPYFSDTWFPRASSQCLPFTSVICDTNIIVPMQHMVTMLFAMWHPPPTWLLM